MTTIESTTATIQLPEPEYLADEAQVAAAGFLARYSGRTLDAYHHDLRGFFQWAADCGLVVLEATRPYIELYRSSSEERGLAASRSIGGSLRSVASTASPTSMGGCRPTRRNMSGVRRSTHPMAAGGVPVGGGVDGGWRVSAGGITFRRATSATATAGDREPGNGFRRTLPSASRRSRPDQSLQPRLDTIPPNLQRGCRAGVTPRADTPCRRRR
jgi:hypothetical protein